MRETIIAVLLFASVTLIVWQISRQLAAKEKDGLEDHFLDQEAIKEWSKSIQLEMDCKNAILDENSGFNKWLTEILIVKPALSEKKFIELYKMFLKEKKNKKA